MRQITLFIGLCALTSYFSFAQQVQIGEMQISWKIQDDFIQFTASAPDDGWVAIGFNDKDNIVGSNLIMINVNGNAIGHEEFYVVGMGNPQPIETVGSSKQVSNVKGYEENGKTTIQFTIPKRAFDEKHYNLRKGDKIWLIGAFSMDDDFNHHSRFRKHVQVTL